MPTPVPSVGVVEPVVSDLGPKDLRLKNCETETELVRALSQQAPVEVQTELADLAVPEDGGEARDISAELRLALENRVAGTYQNAYMAAIDRLMRAEIRVPANAEAIVRVRYWQEHYEGTVSFSMEGRSFTSPYVYRLTYATLEGFRRTACSA